MEKIIEKGKEIIMLSDLSDTTLAEYSCSDGTIDGSYEKALKFIFDYKTRSSLFIVSENGINEQFSDIRDALVYYNELTYKR